MNDDILLVVQEYVAIFREIFLGKKLSNALGACLHLRVSTIKILCLQGDEIFFYSHICLTFIDLIH